MGDECTRVEDESTQQKVDMKKARKYMQQVGEPIISELVQKLAIAQPENVVAFIGAWAQEFLEGQEVQEVEKNQRCCCISGNPADIKVLFENKVEYYAQDIYDALKRKNKLRGAVAVGVDDAFPAEKDVDDDDVPFPLTEEEQERIANGLDDIENRPVTPPKRGFDMARPGEICHDSYGPRAVGPVAPVKFEARALGSENAQDKHQAALDAAQKRAAEHSDNLTLEQRAVLQEKRKKDALVGKIQAHYATMGGCEPLGLAASSIETLQKHLEKLTKRTQATRQDREELVGKREKEAKINEIIQKNFASNKCLVDTEPRIMDYEPRALGTTTCIAQDEPQQEETPQQRRERMALAAQQRFANKK